METNNNPGYYTSRTDRENVPDRAEDIQDAVIIEEQPETVPESGGAPPHVKNPLWVDLLAIIGVFIVASIVGGLIGGFITRTAGAVPEFSNFISSLIAFSITIGFAVWIKYRRKATRPVLAFSFKRSGPILILWGLILVFATSIVLEPVIDLFPDINMQMLRNLIGNGGWAMLSVIVLAPVMEEVLFRGIIQDMITREYGAVKGVLIAAAIFGIVHIIPQQVVNAFFVGIILGYIYIKTKSLVPVIVIHAVNNAFAYVTMTMYEDSPYITMRQIIHNDTWYWILYVLCAAVFLVAGYNVWVQLNKNPNQQE